jgi:hypothetical protein
MKHALRRILLPLALTAVMAFASAGLASASDSTRPSPANCPLITGYVCLAETTGGLQLIPEGQSRTFPGGLPIVEISNGTKSLYCVIASPFNFGVGPKQVRTIDATVRSVAPTDGACLT